MVRLRLDCLSSPVHGRFLPRSKGQRPAPTPVVSFRNLTPRCASAPPPPPPLPSSGAWRGCTTFQCTDTRTCGRALGRGGAQAGWSFCAVVLWGACGLVIEFATGNAVQDFPQGSGVYLASDPTNDLCFTYDDANHRPTTGRAGACLTCGSSTTTTARPLPFPHSSNSVNIHNVRRIEGQLSEGTAEVRPRDSCT